MTECKSFDSRIYQNLPQIVLGFHGCDQSVVDRVLTDPSMHLKPSQNSYDWLGNGVYFWLNDPQRAYEWAVEYAKRRPDVVQNPAVLGAVIDLGNCLNLCERESILLLQKSYSDLSNVFAELGLNIHTEVKNKLPDSGGFKILRELDCLVIEHGVSLVADQGYAFDTVYGYFQEGEAAYPGSEIRAKTHIQIAVRNLDCIKGYFLPRST